MKLKQLLNGNIKVKNKNYLVIHSLKQLDYRKAFDEYSYDNDIQINEKNILFKLSGTFRYFKFFKETLLHLC